MSRRGPLAGSRRWRVSPSPEGSAGTRDPLGSGTSPARPAAGDRGGTLRGSRWRARHRRGRGALCPPPASSPRRSPSSRWHPWVQALIRGVPQDGGEWTGPPAEGLLMRCCEGQRGWGGSFGLTAASGGSAEQSPGTVPSIPGTSPWHPGHTSSWHPEHILSLHPGHASSPHPGYTSSLHPGIPGTHCPYIPASWTHIIPAFQDRRHLSPLHPKTHPIPTLRDPWPRVSLASLHPAIPSHTSPPYPGIPSLA